MERQPLDSVEYESTYLELRPAREPPIGTTDAQILARREATVEVDNGAAPRTGAFGDRRDRHGPVGSSDDSDCCPHLAPGAVRRSSAEAVHPAGGPPGRPLRVTTGRCPRVPSDHLTFPEGSPLLAARGVQPAGGGERVDWPRSRPRPGRGAAHTARLYGSTAPGLGPAGVASHAAH